MKQANDNVIHPYKGRVVDTTLPVRIFRNLNKKGVWYSIRQNGFTVAHSTALCIYDATFVVNQKTRERIIKNKRKEFHAYIEGRLVGSLCGTTAKRNDLPAVIKYNPFTFTNFTCTNLTRNSFPVKGATFVICNEIGVRAAHLIKL